jgi:MtrB/PioB family decaheme-associated outer membrane protein
MKTNKELLTVSSLTLAVQAALVVMFAGPSLAMAANDELDALTQPTKSLEVGIVGASDSSAKFGEYNGLDKSGANLIGNFSIRSGDAYNRSGGINRWSITGTDLGTTSREIRGSVSNQGEWDLGFGYDELQHNLSDTYQTPLLGSMGGNSFTLPANFGVINTSYIDSVTKKGGAQALTATQQSLFHTTDVHSDRKNTSLSAGYMIDRHLGFKFDFNHLDQSGAKLMMVSTDAATAASAPGNNTTTGLGGTWGVEKMLMLMNPTNYTTDTFSLAASWKSGPGHLTASYFGSFFRDGYNGLTFPNPFAAQNATSPVMGTAATFPINTIGTAPSNDFHQLNLAGGYTLSPSMKLAGGLSYGRNTQDETYPFAMLKSSSDTGATGSTANPMGGGQPPVSSLNALVKTTHADLKLTDQTSKDLTLTAGLKFNQRDNETASYTYNYIDLGGKNRTSVNTPMSNSKTQIEIAGDYRISSINRLHLGYEYEGVKRWCNNELANNTVGVPPAGYVNSVSSCVQIPESKENKLVASYKLKANEAVDVNIGYSYSDRSADVNPSFYNPMQALAEGYEATGYRAFFDASRTEQLLKAGVNWQASDKLSLGLSTRYLDDKYTDSPLGVQNGNSWSTNLDATYGYSEDGVVSAYISLQKRQRDLSNLAGHALTGANVWSNQLNDDDSTLGFMVNQKGLMAGKLDLVGDLSYSIGTTAYSTQIPYVLVPNATFAPTCASTGALLCGSTPDIKNETITFKLTGIYQVDKASKVAVGYLYQKLSSTDYYYNFYQTGYTGTGFLPTNEQAPSYSVNAISVSYIYNF